MKKWLLMIALIAGSGIAAETPFEIEPYLGDTWYGLYFNGEKVGYSLKQVARDEDDGIQVVEEAQFKVTMSGTRQDMMVYTKRIYDKSGTLRRIEAEMKDPAQLSTFHAEIRNDGLHLRSVLGGAIREDVFPLPDESLLDALRHAVWVRTNPALGETINFSAFEPMYQKEVSGISRIAGVEQRIFNGVPTRVYEIRSVLDLMDIESTSYVTECGVTVEDVIAGVFTMRLEPETAAKDVDYNVDTMVSNAVSLEAPIQDPRKRPQLRLALRGPLRESHLLNDLRQTMRQADDYVAFYAERTDLATLDIPEIPVEDTEMLPHLAPSAYVQSDDPRLIDKAREIIGDETNALKAAQLLCDWVSSNMRNVFSARLSNALEALESMDGDCTEHTVLYVGLARAAGIPAKKVAGLIYVENNPPGFYFHQWASIWLGAWVDVDPAFNQLPVDVTHIKLAEGDLLRQAKILPLIGRIAIEVQPDELNPVSDQANGATAPPVDGAGE